MKNLKLIYFALFILAACGQESSEKQNPENLSSQRSEAELQAEVKQKLTTLYNSAGAKFKRGDNKGAIEDYSNILSLDLSGVLTGPSLAGIYYNRGVVKDADKDYKGAIDDYTKAIELNPNDADSYHNRSIAKNKIKDKAGAVEDMIKSKKLSNQ